MFTAWYALSPYITQIRFVFKGLMRSFCALRVTDAYFIHISLPRKCKLHSIVSLQLPFFLRKHFLLLSVEALSVVSVRLGCSSIQNKTWHSVCAARVAYLFQSTPLFASILSTSQVAHNTGIQLNSSCPQQRPVSFRVV